MYQEGESGKVASMIVTKPPAMSSTLSRAMAGVFLSWFHMGMHFS